MALVCYGIETTIGKKLENCVTCEMCGCYVLEEEMSDGRKIGECPFCGTLIYKEKESEQNE